VIEDGEIGRFDPVRQSEIRAVIAKLVQAGHERRFLMLGSDGAVMLDRDAITMDAYTALHRDPTDPD
jgi:hypothetical protein